MSDSSSSSSSSEASSSSDSEEEKKKKKKKAKKKGKDKDKKKKKKSKKKDKKGKKAKEEEDDTPFGKKAQEKARLEAQQRGMGISISTSKSKKKKDSKKKKSKKKKKSSSSSSSSSGGDEVERMRKAVEGASALKELQMLREQQQKDREPSPVKAASEMTWPERAAAAAIQAEKDAIWKGATQEEAKLAAEEAGEAVMRRAAQFGFVEEKVKRARFDAGSGQAKKLSPVEQARSAGMHPGVFSGGSGKKGGGGFFGMQAPMMSGGLEGGYMG